MSALVQYPGETASEELLVRLRVGGTERAVVCAIRHAAKSKGGMEQIMMGESVRGESRAGGGGFGCSDRIDDQA